jgi:tetratricopeptide (TPR) repeat protein
MAKKGKNWFDSPDWSPAAQAAFEEKLRRARNKGEYLRTKGAALVEAGDRERRQAGRELLLRLVHDYPETLTLAWAHEFIADAYAEDGNDAEAERHYREALATQERRPGVRGYAGVKLADLITRTRHREKYKEADALVDAFDPLFKIDHFRVFTVRARLAAERGDAEEAGSYARVALDLETDKRSQLPRHPDVGHVRTDEATL